MAEYHVGCGLAGIYAGVLDKKGVFWKGKTDVTRDAVPAVAQYLLFAEKEFRFEHQGKKYVLRVEELNTPDEAKKGG